MLSLVDVLLSYLPYTRWADKLIALYRFFRAHKRWPKRQGGSINDALFYIKTTDEILNPLRVYISDKAFVKEYVRAKLGDRYNVPTIAILSDKQALGFDYPSRCVIKPTHMSAEVMYRYVGEPYNIKEIWRWMHINYYKVSREANYRYLIPKVIVEPFIFDTPTPQAYDDPADYKVFCLRGVPKIIQVSSNRKRGMVKSHYTTTWEPILLTFKSPQGPCFKKPDNLEEMLEVAAILSRDFNLIRIDLYTNDRQVLVGEITNMHGGAHSKFGSKQEEELFTQHLFGSRGFHAIDLW